MVGMMEKSEDRLSAEFPASKSQAQRRQVQCTEGSNAGHVVIKLSKEDLSRLRALSNRTSIPFHILCRALLRQAISRYSLADGLDDLLFQPDGNPPANSLTDREADILNLIVQGVSNRGIASALELSEQTVKNHVTSILRKMKVNNRTQAASLAFKHNLVQAGISGGKRPACTLPPGGVETGRRSDK
jgi:DNA-binding CsgD family transcriptional regulator